MSSSHAVVDGLIRNRPPFSRIGLFDSPWGDTLAKWAGEEGYPRDAAGNPVSPADEFGFDLVGVGGWFDVMPRRGPADVVEETADWKIVRNGAGAALKWWKNKSGTPEHIDFRMTSRAVWEAEYRPHLLAVDRERIGNAAARDALQKRRAEGRWAFYGHLFLWETLRCSLGDVCMFESMVLDPDWIHDFNRVYTDFFKAHYRVLIEEAGKPDGVWIYEDLGYRNGLFCSPRVLADLIFPYYREMVEFFHSYDLPVVLHACGNITEAVPLIVEAGFDALNPMEVKAGCNLLEFAERYGDRLAFIGGFDARILESDDPDLIRREVTRHLREIKARGARYVFGSDHSISTRVTLASFRCAVDAYRDQCAYPA